MFEILYAIAGVAILGFLLLVIVDCAGGPNSGDGPANSDCSGGFDR